jgi:hypothetical protein
MVALSATSKQMLIDFEVDLPAGIGKNRPVGVETVFDRH